MRSATARWGHAMAGIQPTGISATVRRADAEPTGAAIGTRSVVGLAIGSLTSRGTSKRRITFRQDRDRRRVSVSVLVLARHRKPTPMRGRRVTSLTIRIAVSEFPRLTRSGELSNKWGSGSARHAMCENPRMSKKATIDSRSRGRPASSTYALVSFDIARLDASGGNYWQPAVGRLTTILHSLPPE
jgi:hypothetical protein